MRKWRIEDSSELYNVPGWGHSYFKINDAGHVEVSPRQGCPPVDLKDLMDELALRDVTAPVLLRFPDIMHADAADSVTDEETATLRRAVADAVEQPTAHRRAEGIRLEEFFRTRIANIAALLDEVPRYEGERLSRIRARIEDGLAKISVAEYDKGRLEQEMIFYIEKLDISEEKQRLTQHLRYFIETLELPEPGQGKKLGFIAQEMGREINTLGSKSNHAEMQIIVVKMKDELEQIKEQVLNVL